MFFSDKYTRFCQWKNLELNIQVYVNKFHLLTLIRRHNFQNEIMAR